MYNRYAESARVKYVVAVRNTSEPYADFVPCSWTLNFAASDLKNKTQWIELMTPNSVGLILRSIKTDYKFVSVSSLRRHLINAVPVNIGELCNTNISISL
jgi:hypothetical protein